MVQKFGRHEVFDNFYLLMISLNINISLCSQNSERDSLDENILSSGDSSDPTLIRAQNVYQTLPPILPPRKMETTEL